MGLPERVARRVVQQGECLTWTGARNNKGYGSIGISHQRSALVHRFVYERMVGPIPDGLTIDHLCMNKRCVNVQHMEVVTRAENSRRAAAARRPKPLRSASAGGDFTDLFASLIGHART